MENDEIIKPGFTWLGQGRNTGEQICEVSGQVRNSLEVDGVKD